MGKHAWAKGWIRLEREAITHKDGLLAEELDHILKVLEAIEGVEEWMVEWLTAPDTDQAWEHVPEDLTVKVGEEPRWTRVDARIADTLQAILDAKGAER